MTTLSSRANPITGLSLAELIEAAGVTIDITVDHGVDPITISFAEGGNVLLMGTLGSGDFKITDILTLLGRMGFPLNYEELP